ncbi:glycoside hydrolase family 31 protein [Haliovirga abyssi]|uniref:DUF5110 domain-containing protein n=1 Tax=Haliovirga abyssi TaxID=2996794 RepID=A0AAU9D6C7_9FUSO|nr:TIM-barrel domain-containing protein [Haliovirga abyssi]BDU51544.1 hypothetical protein HLVA_21130 [Haliovirga abyssi]
MKKIVILIFILLSINIFSQETINNNKLKLKFKNGINISFYETTKGKLRVTALSKDMKLKKNRFFINKEKSNVKIKKDGNRYILGKYIIEEIKNGYKVNLESNNKLLYSSVFSITKKGFLEIKNSYDKELFHGMGEANDKSSIIAKQFMIYQKAEYGNQAKLYIPFYFTTGGDAYYYNSNSKDIFKFGRRGSAVSKVYSKYGYLDYYYFYENSPKKIVSEFYKFSKSNSLIPKWAFGYLQSKYGYKNSEEVYNLIKKFKKYNIPVSGVILDLYWFKHMGDLDWDKDNWKDVAKLDRYLEENGVKLITISEPFFTVDSKSYKDFNKNGVFAKDKYGKTLKLSGWWCFGSEYGGIMNPIAKNSFDTIGNRYVQMRKTGIDGFWTDLGEPEGDPTEAYFNGYSEFEFHNYYNREWSKLIYKKMVKVFPNERPLILSRSGFTGSAKYNVSVWSGDSSSSYINFRKQIGIGINAGISGFSYWGSDVGGFLSDRKKPKKELFIRWMQFGTFVPVFRAHGSFSPREPWMYDDETTKLLKSYIDLRYQMLPYIYSTAYETYLNGVPMMRPLYLEYPKDNFAQKSSLQYFFGDFLMAAPVVRRIREKKEKEVYLPKGNWYDFYDLKKIVGGNKIKVKRDINKIPVYIKEGAILPFKDLILLFPAEKKSEFTLYNDDGISNNYLKGDYSKIKIILKKDSVEFEGIKKEMTFNLKIVKNGGVIKKVVELKKGDNKILFE